MEKINSISVANAENLIKEYVTASRDAWVNLTESERADFKDEMDYLNDRDIEYRMLQHLQDNNMDMDNFSLQNIINDISKDKLSPHIEYIGNCGASGLYIYVMVNVKKDPILISYLRKSFNK